MRPGAHVRGAARRPGWHCCPVSRRCGAQGSCWRRSSRRPIAKEVSAGALGRGLLVNAVRPDAIRVAPPLLVHDAEVDAALDILGEVLALEGRRSAVPAEGGGT